MLQSIMDFDTRAVNAMGLKSDHIVFLHWFEKERAFGATSIVHDSLLYTRAEAGVILKELPCLDRHPKDILDYLEEKFVLKGIEAPDESGRMVKYYRMYAEYITLIEAYKGDD